MKRCIASIVFLLCFCGLSLAQVGGNQQVDRTVSIGFKGGINMPRMLYYHNEALGGLGQEITLTPMGALFVEIPVGDALIIEPEAAFVSRGTDIQYEHFSSAQVHYVMDASYVDLRMPFEFRWLVARSFQPYFFVGAEAGMRLFGQIHIDRSAPVSLSQTIDVGDANLNLIHAGVLAGVGIRSRFDIGRLGMAVKLSAGLHQGLLDSYSSMEREGAAQPVNVNAYQITGYRLPQGLEVTLGIAIPLELQAEDACSTFSRDRYRRYGSGGHLFGY